MNKTVVGGALLFGLGLCGGVVVGSLLTTDAAMHTPEYVLRQDLNLEKTEGDPRHPVKAVLHAGTRFRVARRKGFVNYVELRTILLDQDLAGNAVAMKAGAESPWAYLSQSKGEGRKPE